MTDFPNVSVADFLLRGLNQMINQTEREICQHQNNQKENETAQAAILETFSALDFYAIEYPVGHEIEAGGNQSVVNDFQSDSP
jgi:hypothetical protein